MCGIVACYSRREPVSQLTLERATRSLFHRGPDGQRYWISTDGRIGLGHARLSIIDLTTGDQPIASEDEKNRVIVNGEFYGYEEIQRDLEARGHRLRTRSDSEIALHLYEDYGVQCLHHLRGDFAMVLWDEPRRMIFSARDRFGIKPLFYAWTTTRCTSRPKPRRFSRRVYPPVGMRKASSTPSPSAATRCGRCSTVFSRSRPRTICW